MSNWIPRWFRWPGVLGKGVGISMLNYMWLMYCVRRFQEQHPEMDFSNAKMG